jgi:hypothetical protein
MTELLLKLQLLRVKSYFALTRPTNFWMPLPVVVFHSIERLPIVGCRDDFHVAVIFSLMTVTSLACTS